MSSAAPDPAADGPDTPLPASSRTLRTSPNIAITGTPAVGKTTLCTALVARLPRLRHLSLSSLASEHACLISHDERLQTSEIDEDALAGALAPGLAGPPGGAVLDWMHADFWPEGMLDLVVTVRAPHAVLHRRYEERGYGGEKVEENIDAEIMGVIAEENRECFGGVEGMLWEVEGEDVEGTVERLVGWVEKWEEDARRNEGGGGIKAGAERPVVPGGEVEASSTPVAGDVSGDDEGRRRAVERSASGGNRGEGEDEATGEKKKKGPMRKLVDQIKQKGTTSKTDSPQLEESEASLKDLLS